MKKEIINMKSAKKEQIKRFMSATNEEYIFCGTDRPKKHKHDYEIEINDCKYCGFEEMLVCEECGKEKKPKFDKKGRVTNF